MARKKQTKGSCGFCGKEMTRGGLQRHLASCKAREAANAEAANGKSETLYHLVAKDGWGGTFWLHLEMRGSAKLSDLDNYLRGIWLECCGHMSQFSFGGWRGEEIGMNRPISQVLTVGGEELTHIYDFGTESVTLIGAVGQRKGQPLTKYPIFLMARNELPEVECQECGEPAKWMCMECQYEHDESGLLCDEHAEAHPHDEYGEPIQLVNSPRVGMCGEITNAEPPY
jgi:hypothetical protein